MQPEALAKSLRPALPLAVAWRIVTELYRRHYSTCNLRLLRHHPGSSVNGQLRMLVNPSAAGVVDCDQLALNLGGPTGTFEVQAGGSCCGEGEFLWAALSADPINVVDRIERYLKLPHPSSLPKTAPAVLVMRLVSDMLAASFMDRTGLAVETAWFDWSGGSKVQPWAQHFGKDVAALQRIVDIGGDWQSVFFEVSDLLRLVKPFEVGPGSTEVLFDLHDAAALVLERGQVVEKVDLMAEYDQASRRLEPLTSRMLSRLGRG